MWKKAALVLFCTVLCSGIAQAQVPLDVRAHYTKTDQMITMRDGVRLFTTVFAPRDRSRPYPIMFIRTPYSVPYGQNFPGTLGPSARFGPAGFIFAYQDVRGKFMSEGEYVNMRPELPEKHGPKDIDESTDTYDTIEWLVKHIPNNNGRVGMWGISYPGFYAAAGAIHAHPALKAVSPQAPIADWFLGDDVHHNGAFYLMDNFAWDFDSSFDYPRKRPSQTWEPVDTKYDSNDCYTFYRKLGPLRNANARYFHNRIPFWNELMEHDTYDAYWKARNLLPHLKQIQPAMLIVGGWFDAEDFYGPLHIFHTITQNSPQTPNYLVIGPWPHGGWSHGDGASFGDIAFHSKPGETYRDTIEFPFFNHYLKGIAMPKPARARVFATGSNAWLSFDSWPPQNLKSETLYFEPSQGLSPTPAHISGVFKWVHSVSFGIGVRPVNRPKLASNQTERTLFKSGLTQMTSLAAGLQSLPASTEADSLISDPANPVPYAPYSDITRKSEYMIADQRFTEKRADVLTYSTSALTADTTVVGPITADLYVSTTGTDADWIVKVIDAYPPDAPSSESATGMLPMGSYEMLVRADVMRGKFRNGFETPTPFKLNEVTRVRFALPDICHTFRKGHHMMVQVQCSWFPLVDRNPQRFMNISTASESDFQTATHRLYHNERYPSALHFFVK